MTSLDQYIETRFKDKKMKRIYVSRDEYDKLELWIKANCGDYTKYYGRYEAFTKHGVHSGERHFYISSTSICVEYSRHNFRNNFSARYRGETDWQFYQNFTGVLYLLNYEILVKENES